MGEWLLSFTRTRCEGVADSSVKDVGDFALMVFHIYCRGGGPLSLLLRLVYGLTIRMEQECYGRSADGSGHESRSGHIAPPQVKKDPSQPDTPGAPSARPTTSAILLQT